MSFNTTALMQADYIANIKESQKKSKKQMQNQVNVYPVASKLMSKDGVVRINFESELLKVDDSDIARLKEEALIELKLIPSDEATNMLTPASLEYDWEVVDLTT